MAIVEWLSVKNNASVDDLLQWHYLLTCRCVFA